jgi:LysR family transcriptional regulator, nitrogen assimilation regulatory protein
MSTDLTKKWDLAKLELFAAVAELGSLTKVAAARNSAQPVISRQIAALERECGGRLFARTGRGMALTELGQRILPRIKAILANAEELSQDVGANSGVPMGDVRIGSLPSLYKLLIVPLFRVVRERFPGIRLHIFEGSGGQIDEWISNGYVDIGLPYRYGRRLPSDVQKLIAVDSCLIGPAGDPLTASRTVEFAQLAGIPLVLPGAPSMVRLMLDQLAKRKGITFNIVLEADSLQIQKEVVLNGFGYTINPRHSALTEIKRGLLQASRIVNPAFDRTVVLVTTSTHPPSLACREVAKLIRQLAEATP